MKLNKEQALAHFSQLLDQQIARNARMKEDTEFTDFAACAPLIIGVCAGDGIGPAITAEAERILRFLLAEDVASGKVEIRTIEGLTLENRLAKGKAIPDDVLAELKACHLILKGPTTTPDAGDKKNVGSANVAMRRELDLFCNLRPVRIPELGIDWAFFRENTEGAYAMGEAGFEVDGVSLDFTVATEEGTERIARLAYDYAQKNGKKRVSVITKANVIKQTDGQFLNLCKQVGEEYPDIITDDWYADILTAKLLDESRRAQFEVMVLPNLYGDIVTDEAAQIQGGVGTAGGANIGRHYAMFEAIHGSGVRMVEEGRAQYADPSSIIRAAAMLLAHAGYTEKANALNTAMDRCAAEKKLVITGRADGATCTEFADYIMQTLTESC